MTPTKPRPPDAAPSPPARGPAQSIQTSLPSADPLTKIQRAQAALYSHLLNATVFEVAPKPCHNRRDVITYTITKLIIDPQIVVTADSLGDKMIKETISNVMLVVETPGGAPYLRDAAKFKSSLVSRAKALARLDQLVASAEENDQLDLLARWQDYQQQIAVSSEDTLFR